MADRRRPTHLLAVYGPPPTEPDAHTGIYEAVGGDDVFRRADAGVCGD